MEARESAPRSADCGPPGGGHVPGTATVPALRCRRRGAGGRSGRGRFRAAAPEPPFVRAVAVSTASCRGGRTPPPQATQGRGLAVARPGARRAVPAAAAFGPAAPGAPAAGPVRGRLRDARASASRARKPPPPEALARDRPAPTDAPSGGAQTTGCTQRLPHPGRVCEGTGSRSYSGAGSKLKGAASGGVSAFRGTGEREDPEADQTAWGER